MKQASILDFFPPVGVLFTVELELTAANEESAAKLMRLSLENGELLPGIKVNKVYRPIESPQTIGSDMLIDGIEKEYNDMICSLQKTMQKFFENRFRIEAVRQKKYDAIKGIVGDDV